MPKKIQECTMAQLISVPLPQHAATYTVISHQFVIDYAKQQLTTAGFIIVDEEYRCTADGQIAQGVYKLNFNSDPELSMMFAWTNSYNKQVKFKCVVGAYINNTGSVMISGEVGSWVRKHMGTADVETKDVIDNYIINANLYYDQLCVDKAVMETITLNRRRQAQMLGILFAEYSILTTEQASLVRDQMKKSTHVFSNSDSLWAFYNHVTSALQLSHPRTWMEDQRILHMFITEISKVSAVAKVPEPSPEPVDPLVNNYGHPENQTNLLVQIAEVTGDDTVLQVQQSGTNEDKNEEVLYQSEEVVEDVSEDIEVPFDIDEDDDAVLDTMLVPIETEAIDFHNTVVQEETEITAEEELLPPGLLDEAIMKYTDPAGNTFEAPIVPPCAGHDFETEKEEFLSLEPSPEDFELFEEEERKEFMEPTEANLELTEEVEEDFDLDFDITEEEDDENIPDFF
jgi:hypothetical protein